jgi:RNA polymerase sigma-70 factor, ECF subfamily
MNAEPDELLVERVRAGDLRAFERLVERHRGRVYRVAARVVGPADADDVAQDALLRAFHRLGSYTGRGSFRGWLLRITHHTALNTMARRRPEPVADPGDGDDGDLVALHEREPARLLVESERRERLESKLTELRPEHRAVLVLRDLEGLPYDEIAEITEAPLGSVKGRLFRARRELIDIMRRNTYDWELPDDAG